MKLNPQQVDEIREITLDGKRFYGRRELAKKYNVSESTIKDVVTYKSYNR